MNLSSHSEDTRFLELLQKWQSGDFTRADEQEMNTLASTDEFRREAMDGFLDHPEYDHGTMLRSLSTRIQGKRKKRRVLIPQILSLAAALALIFGAIWFFNIRPVPQDKGTMAQDFPAPSGVLTEPEQPTISTPNTPVKTPDISRSVSPQAQGKAAPEKDIASRDIIPDNPVLDEKEATKQEDDVAAIEEKRSATAQPPGAVLGQSTNAAPPREMAEEAAGRAQKKMESAKPVPTYNEGKADKAKASTSTPVSSEPVRGWDAFHAYLNANARLTQDALAHNVTGTVRLQFQLNSKNQPVDFVVVRGLGHGCDEEAIRLVKDISWMRIGVDPITVDVPFVR